MEIYKAEFVKSFSEAGPLLEWQRAAPLPEIALVGKSNVGKSSLINALTRHGKLAKVSGTPGKTRLINLFLIDDRFYLVDLPGYGYAKASKAEQAKWGPMIEGYLRQSEHLLRLMLLVDIRHDPTVGDRQMKEWLDYYGIGCTLVTTKADKLSRGKALARVKAIRQIMGMEAQDVVMTGEGIGREALLESIELMLGESNSTI